MVPQIGPYLAGGGGILRIPDEGLLEGFDRLRIPRVTLEQLATLGPGLRVVGEDAAEGDLVSRVLRKLIHEGAQTGNGVGAAVFGGGFRLIVGQ